MSIRTHCQQIAPFSSFLDAISRPKAKIALSFFFLISFTFVLFAQSLFFDFVNYDDRTVLLSNKILFSNNNLFQSIKAIFFDYLPREEPLLIRDISWLIDSYLFGLENPFGFHLGNVILNSFNTGLLFLFLYATTNKYTFSFLTAFIFSILPIHVEPVCWIMGRKDLLSTFFVLLGLFFQSSLLNISDQNTKKKIIYYIGSLICVLFATLSKINSVIFFLILLLHYIFHPYLKHSRYKEDAFQFIKRAKKSVIAILPHTIVCIVVFLWYQNVLNEYGMFNRGPAPLSLAHIQTLSKMIPIVLLSYFKLLAYPFQNSIFYVFPSMALPIPTHILLFSLCLLFSLLFLGYYLFRRKRDLLFYYFSFFIFMIPYCNIVYIGYWVANRYIYTSVFCICAIISTFYLNTIKRCSSLTKSIAYSSFVCLLFINTWQTFSLQHVWKNDLSLWSYEVNYLKQPSILSIQALAKYHMQTATQNEVPHELQSQHLEQASKLIDYGIQLFNERGYKRTQYKVPVFYYYARLINLRGRIYLFRHDPISALQYFEQAYKLNSIDPANNYFLYTTHAQLARQTSGLEREKHIQETFTFFGKFSSYYASDPNWTTKLQTEQNRLIAEFGVQRHH